MSAHETKEDQKIYSQHYVDLLDLTANKLTTIPLDELIKDNQMNQKDQTLNLDDVGEIDWEATRLLEEIGIRNRKQWIINFRKILSDKYLIDSLQTILQTLENAYKYPVDIEFTINPSPQNKRMINILQCRPLQTKRIGPSVVFPDSYDIRNVYIRSYGHFMGGNVSLAFKYIIYVRPEKYVELTQQERYQVARMIGQLNHLIIDPQTAPTLLLGPGRWGTTTPSLGVPVKFSEISNIAALGEIAFMTAGMIPELSFGSHFFQDLVESDIFYMAILPYLSNTVFQKDMPKDMPNLFAHILPQYKDWENVISVHDFSQRGLVLFSDITSQQVLCLQTGHPLLMDEYS